MFGALFGVLFGAVFGALLGAVFGALFGAVFEFNGLFLHVGIGFFTVANLKNLNSIELSLGLLVEFFAASFVLAFAG